MASNSEDMDCEHMQLMQGKLTEAWVVLNDIWAKVGYDEELILKRRNVVVKHLTELLDDMCQEAGAKLEEQRVNIQTLMQEIQQLAKDLSIDQVPEIAAAHDKPFLEMQKILEAVALDLRKRKAIRMEKYNNINAKVVELSDELGEAPMQIEFEGIPADSQVNKLEHHLGQLQREKLQRIEQFYNYKKSVGELFELLEQSPKNNLELLLLNTEDEISTNHTTSASGIKALSRDTFEAINEIESRCLQQLDVNSQQGQAFWQKIRELWSRLSADEEMMQIFAQVHRPLTSDRCDEVYKPSVLKGLQKELERLEEEKRLNMSLFTQQCRQEMCDLWVNKCFMTSVQDRFMEPNYLGLTSFAITDFNDEMYTEELLEKHEREVEFWKDFVERNKKIIEGVMKRGEMFAQYKILDQKSDDPSRLANRGGALLKEEKERKKLEKAIPKLESELKKLCVAFENEADAGHGMIKFLVYGRTIDEMIEQDWELFHEEKRLRKEAKKNPKEAAAAGSNKTMMTTQLSNPGSRKRPLPVTPSSTQRGGAVTPSKKNRTTALTPGKTFQSPFLPPPTQTAPSNSTKRVLQNAPRKDKQGKNLSMQKNWYFRPNTSTSQAASKKILRKSIGKIRNASSLLTNSSSSGSSDTNAQKTTCSSQPNLQMNMGSLEQLNFSKIIRGSGPPGSVVAALTPPKSSSRGNFAQPSTLARSAKKTPSKTNLLRQPSAGKINLPTKLTGKEQVPPSSSSDRYMKDSLISPDGSYSEFTDHLLCQSTLNSSAVVPIQKYTPGSGPVPTSSTKSGMAFAPAKLPLSDNRF